MTLPNSPGEVWLCVSFDVSQRSKELRWWPEFNPQLRGNPPPGGLYQWIGPHAGRVLLCSGDRFRVLVTSLYKTDLTEKHDLKYTMEVKECDLEVLRIQTDANEDPRRIATNVRKIAGWRDLDATEGGEVDKALITIARATQVTLPLNHLCKISDSQSVEAGTWTFSMELTVEIGIDGNKPVPRIFHFDPECQVGTGT